MTARSLALGAFLIFFGLTELNAQKMDFKKEWTKVEAAERKGLTQTALAQVKNILALASREANGPQLVKAVIRQIGFENVLQRDNEINKQLSFLDSLIGLSNVPVRNILESVYAEILQAYRNNNRYNIYGRTKLETENAKDVKTWSADKLHHEIANHHRASLLNSPDLQKTPISQFDAILEKGNTRSLRPVLYDLLAHRALEYFRDEETYITQPSYKFKLEDEKIFSSAAEFSQRNFLTQDSSSNHLWALKLYQQLLIFHLQDAAPEALLDVDLSRLEFVFQHSTHTGKTDLFEQALLSLEKRFPGSEVIARAMFLRANIYYSAGQQYDPFTNPSPQFGLQKAVVLCDSAIKRFPGSEGAVQCYNFRLQISEPELEMETESVNIPGQGFRSLIKYRNLAKLHLRVIKFSRKELLEWNQADDDNITWASLRDKESLKEWQITLPDQGDFQQHSAEIKIDALPAGIYVLLASKNADFVLQKNILARQVFYVSNISYIINRRGGMYVLHRDSGEPLANAIIQTWEQKYNYTTRRTEPVKTGTYQSNKEGGINIEKNDKDFKNSYYQLNFKGEELFTDDIEYNHNYNAVVSEDKTKVFFFTDRNIYRPGQTIYFKGIVVNVNSTTPSKNNATTGSKTTVQLLDANGQKISDLVLTTNEFGTYNGSFTLPQTGLTGVFRLRDSLNNGQGWFRVEEYKRPKFSVEISKLQQAYKLYELVTVSGNAKAYAGNNIAGAKVIYRVTRKVRYPVWWADFGYGKSWPPGRSEQMEITNGEIQTSDDGSFKISFTAIPDEKSDKKYQPVFSYEVTADVTDLNGETRSARSTVHIGYQPIEILIDAVNDIEQDSLSQVRVFTKDLDGEFQKTPLRIQLQKLQEPETFFRTRYWEQPDQFTLTETEYRQAFPYDVYRNESDPKQWPVSSTQSQMSDSSRIDGMISWKQSSLQPGWYKITAVTNLKDSSEVRAEKIIYVKGKQATKKPLEITVAKAILAPGEKTAYHIKTVFQEIWLIETRTQLNEHISSKQAMLSGARPFENSILISEEDRGGINLNYVFVKHNRVYSANQMLEIPWTNKDLSIQYETFRDKTLPGAEEKWKIRISGKQSERLAAEALVTMYDASLDQFYKQDWPDLKSLWPMLTHPVIWYGPTFELTTSAQRNGPAASYKSLKEKLYDRLLPLPFSGFREYHLESVVVTATALQRQNSKAAPTLEAADENTAFAKFPKPGGVQNEERKYPEINQQVETPQENVTVRKDFRETAFFFPELRTDPDGNIEFSFTIPEALTSWKMRMMAHDKALASIFSEKTVITQKPLMLQPNAPRFFREGDQLEFISKVVNLSEKEITGRAELELFDAATNKPVDGWFKNIFPTQYFTVTSGQSAVVKFPIEIPFNYNSSLGWRIKATSNDRSFSDGEEQVAPVLTNRMLITESMPLHLRNEKSKTFRFDKLIQSANSPTLTQHQLTVEYSSNPAWYAVQALPYLMEYPYECSEQNFNRYYANTLASSILENKPLIRAVFDKWRQATPDSTALISNLFKNQELKSALLEETPWVAEAQDETAQKKNIAILFDLSRLAKEQASSLEKLKEMQTENGGFAWFKGGRDNEFITAYILTGIGHLRKLNVVNEVANNALIPVIQKALTYLDTRLKERYDQLQKNKTGTTAKYIDPYCIQQGYMRSFFPDYPVAVKSAKAYEYFKDQAKKNWLSQTKYLQAMIALSAFRSNDLNTANAILRSLEENAVHDPEMGMYFTELARGGYYWYQAPVEAQSLLIEAFTEIKKNRAVVDELKTWLLKQKQTHNWPSTKATAEACYALLLQGSDWLETASPVNIQLGSIAISSNAENIEAGTGYFKKTFSAEKMKSEMGNITVSRMQENTGASPSWGAVYWQYFENLDKITTAETGLKLQKKLFLESNSDRGPVLKSISDGDDLHIGDKIKVRIELQVDRDLEFVHMKDMRSSGMEPVNVLSSYKWQDGLGYYESTRDASTNFFFDWLPRGTYVFEYPLFITHAGNFSNGITSIQCMYAPEFTSHSEGIRINVSSK